MTRNEKTLTPIFDDYCIPQKIRADIVQHYAEVTPPTPCLLVWSRQPFWATFISECDRALSKEFTNRLFGKAAR